MKKIKILRFNSTRVAFALGAILVLISSFVLWHTHRYAKTPAAVQSTAVSVSPVAKKTISTPVVNKSSPKNPAANGNTTSASLIAPYGTYASDHSPESANQTEQSICSTSVGASCIISFSLSGITKSLVSQAIGSSGSVSWKWTPRQVGLTSGNWKISMTATLNGQTRTSSDLIVLEIP